jgi:hypothetical protein
MRRMPFYYEPKILRDGEEPVVTVLVGHSGEGKYPGRVGSGSVQARANRVGEAVFRGE